MSLRHYFQLLPPAASLFQPFTHSPTAVLSRLKSGIDPFYDKKGSPPCEVFSSFLGVFPIVFLLSRGVSPPPDTIQCWNMQFSPLLRPPFLFSSGFGECFLFHNRRAHPTFFCLFVTGQFPSLSGQRCPLFFSLPFCPLVLSQYPTIYLRDPSGLALESTPPERTRTFVFHRLTNHRQSSPPSQTRPFSRFAVLFLGDFSL